VIQLLFACTGILLLFYAGLIFYYHQIWDRIPAPADPPDNPATGSSIVLTDQTIPHTPSGSPGDLTLPPVKVSVIIPARNEAAHIGNCLQSLFRQTYPKALTEILVVNDFSTDETAAVVWEQREHCRLLNLSDYVTDSLNAYKKKAIETGITHSSGELIICTDADCSMGPDWIQTLVDAYQKENLHFIAAPVKIVPDKTALSIFQTLDFISLQGITGAAVYKNLYPMCNGANLAYTRNAYETVGGFTDIDQIASGDDMLLMKKIQAYFPGRSGYIKDRRAIVSTGPAENFRDFFSQRIRWASKISHYKHPATFFTLALVYLLNAGLLLLFISCFFYGHWRWLLVFIGCKTVSEYFFVAKVASFFRQQSLMKYFALCQPFHIVYTVIAGSFGSFGSYEWKNRKVK
jgi:cellulose synthase/poly-beta-1,6-N-acetylglucosamine synthase-like glycosyltransferase